MQGRESFSAPLFQTTVDRSLLYLLALAATLTLGVASFAISATVGLLVTVTITFLLIIAAPAIAPMFVLAAFLFQNLLTAAFTPLVSDVQALDVLRATNFVILVSAFLLMLITVHSIRHTLPAAMVRQIKFVIILTAIIVFYLLLGMATGSPRDAVVYFRNTFTPIATFSVGLITAYIYRFSSEKIILMFGALAVLFGYCELIFQIDFLALFNGDDYYGARFVDDLSTNELLVTGLTQPGDRYPGLREMLTVPLFNLTFIDSLVPKVFRLSGPNFHPISYAYAVAIITCWRLFSGKWLFLLVSLPILIAVGSKGAMMLVVASIMMRVISRLLGTKIAMTIILTMLVSYTSLAIVVGYKNQDYHVIGFVSGIRSFPENPIGRGLGQGGNLSDTARAVLNWQKGQNQGYTDIPVESTLSVMLYQMGILTFVYYMWIIGIIRTSLSFRDASPMRYFPFAVLSAIIANSVLQEEAFYAPLGLGFALLLAGLLIGNHIRTSSSPMTPVRPAGPR